MPRMRIGGLWAEREMASAPFGLVAARASALITLRRRLFMRGDRLVSTTVSELAGATPRYDSTSVNEPATLIPRFSESQRNSRVLKGRRKT